MPQQSTRLHNSGFCLRPAHGISLVSLLTVVGLNLLTSPATRAAEPKSLRVLCYNIHYGQGTDGKYDVERLAAVIRQARPDIVALQEVDVRVRRSGKVHQAQRLGEFTGMAVRFGPTQHYEGGLFGNAVLTSFRIDNVVIEPLPYTESTPERTTYPRAALEVMLRLSDNRRLRFISTHFQHNVPEDRVAEAHAINRLFAGDADEVPTILAGDMNARPAEEPIEVLLTKWSHAMDEKETPTAPSVNPRSRIDYVFHRGHGHLRVKSSEVIPESVASDHRPVLVEFELLK